MASRGHGQKLLAQLSARYTSRVSIRHGARFASTAPEVSAKKPTYAPNYTLISAIAVGLAGTVAYKMVC